MTDAEKQKTHQDAERDAAVIGGIIALLLLRRNQRRVRFDSHNLAFIVDGKPVGVTAIRDGLERMANRQTAVINRVTDELIAGKITVEQWLEEMRRAIGTSHSIAGALSLGSLALALASQTVVRNIDREWTYAEGFARDIRRSQQSAVSGSGTGAATALARIPTAKPDILRRARSRARSYLSAARITFWTIDLAVHKAVGYKEARRLLTTAEHCTDTDLTHGCLELEAKDWIDINEMVPIGHATCGRFCKCFIQYR
jgi:hypothetical protein